MALCRLAVILEYGRDLHCAVDQLGRQLGRCYLFDNHIFIRVGDFDIPHGHLSQTVRFKSQRNQTGLSNITGYRTLDKFRFRSRQIVRYAHRHILLGYKITRLDRHGEIVTRHVLKLHPDSTGRQRDTVASQQSRLSIIRNPYPSLVLRTVCPIGNPGRGCSGTRKIGGYVLRCHLIRIIDRRSHLDLGLQGIVFQIQIVGNSVDPSRYHARLTRHTQSFLSELIGSALPREQRFGNRLRHRFTVAYPIVQPIGTYRQSGIDHLHLYGLFRITGVTRCQHLMYGHIGTCISIDGHIVHIGRIKYKGISAMASFMKCDIDRLVGIFRQIQGISTPRQYSLRRDTHQGIRKVSPRRIRLRNKHLECPLVFSHIRCPVRSQHKVQILSRFNGYPRSYQPGVGLQPLAESAGFGISGITARGITEYKLINFVSRTPLRVIIQRTRLARRRPPLGRKDSTVKCFVQLGKPESHIQQSQRSKK